MAVDPSSLTGVCECSYRTYIDPQGRKVHELLRLRDRRAPSAKQQTRWVTEADELGSARRSQALTVRGEVQQHPSEDYGFGKGIVNAWCGCGHNLNPGDCDAAAADLKVQTDAFPGGQGKLGLLESRYSIRGGVVAFVCANTVDDVSKSSHDFEWDSSILTLSLGAITKLCGLYVAGTLGYLS